MAAADEALQTLEGARWRQSPGDFGIGGRYPVKEVFGAAAATWQGEAPAQTVQTPCHPNRPSLPGEACVHDSMLFVALPRYKCKELQHNGGNLLLTVGFSS